MGTRDAGCLFALSFYTRPLLLPMTPRATTWKLVPSQLALCRSRLKDWVILQNERDREKFCADLSRDVWLLENADYNWQEHGKPEESEDTTYYWTENVRPPLFGLILKAERAFN